MAKQVKQPFFSAKDYLKFAMLILGGLANYFLTVYNLKLAIHTEITTRIADVRILQYQLDDLKNKIPKDKQTSELNFHYNAVLPDPIGLYKKKII